MRTRQVESGRRWGRAGSAALVIAAAMACLAAFGAAEAGAATLPRVHVSGQQMRDAYGRQVLLRGVNDTSLTDQYQVNPNLPTVIPLQASDYDRMQGFGFNVLRLAVNWSKLEPQRGQISQDYIQRIRNVVDNAAAHGIYTVIDMHSGGWGKDVERPAALARVDGRAEVGDVHRQQDHLPRRQDEQAHPGRTRGMDPLLGELQRGVVGEEGPRDPGPPRDGVGGAGEGVRE
ncbi:MAG: glycoside hydrolase family 5 protein [Actinobacteria bacterium]|nr:MAG: glycoside hydrolase family 5 protein [Actinomycetota bacterium]